MKKFVLMLACGLFFTTVSFAQLKLGYINSQELLREMPELNKVDTELKTFAKTYQDQLEVMDKELQKKYGEYQAQEKTMTEAMKDVKQKELQSLQTRMQSTQQSAEEKISKKREELYSPILKKADDAIKAVAKEKGYDYIFDGAGGGLLYAKDSDNILPLVKAKLGIK